MGAQIESWNTTRRKQDFSAELARKGWLHSFRLPDGREFEGYVSLPELSTRVSCMPIPENLAGKRVLDIGAWDGWYSFEMERRGAGVVAIDCVEVSNFRYIHKELGSKVDYRVADMFDLFPDRLGCFDIVLFLSVLYHLKYPLLALERVCALTTDLAVVSSFITDDNTRPRAELLTEIPRMEFYETDELGGHLDNWFGPNVACLLALCRAAGFARVDLFRIDGPSAYVACYRHWLPVGENPSEAPQLLAAVHSRNYGINFSSRAEEYVSCWFRSDQKDLARDEILPEVGAYGVPCLFVARQPNGVWQCNLRLPPGLTPGWYQVGLRVRDSAPSNPLRIAVDLPLEIDKLVLKRAADGFTFEPGVIHPGSPRVVSAWVLGLPENADRHNVHVFLDSIELAVEVVTDAADQTSQVNAVLPECVQPGSRQLSVFSEGIRSPGLSVDVRAHLAAVGL